MLAEGVQLPRTGQAVCYEPSGGPVGCPGTGQDGDLKAGAPWPNPRFMASGDCVTDRLTGLMWVKAPDSTKRSWGNALAHANAMELCDHADWRLPNANEMESLVNAEVTNTASWLNGQGFTAIQPDAYWTSTSETWMLPASISPLAVNMRYGDLQYRGQDSLAWPVRTAGIVSTVDLPATGQVVSYGPRDDGALRQGIAWPPNRLEDMGDGTVADHLTGLIWLQDLNCRDTVAGVPRTYGRLDWANALTWSNGLGDGACSLSDGSNAGDWRLPNRKELMSLLDRSQFYLALPAGHPFLNGDWGDSYWTSTTYADDPRYAWLINLRNGVLVNDSKIYSHYVVPVRSEPALPWAPSRLRARATGSSSVVLAWTDNATDETGFRIQREPGACDSAASWISIAVKGADSIQHTDVGPAPSATYSYRIRAYNGQGQSGYSGCASATTAKAGTPLAPTGLSAISVGDSSIKLTWTDRSVDELRFEIWRKQGDDPWVRRVTTAANAVSYLDATASGNSGITEFRYYLRACNAAGCSPNTSTAIVPFRPHSLAATALSGVVRLTWWDNSDDETAFLLQRKDGACAAAGTWAALRTLVANETGQADTTVVTGQTYSYRIRATAASDARPLAVGYSRFSDCVSSPAY